MADSKTALARADALTRNLEFGSQSRWRIRAILDGGTEAIRALLGDKMANIQAQTPFGSVPWPNLIHSGLTALAQKLGQIPEARINPPPHRTDSTLPRRRAEKRERIVDGYDTHDRMELQLPQVGRWLPGYGFAVWTVSQRQTPDGHFYPSAQLRDPFDAHPGEWGVDQQPDELAIRRRIPPLEAIRLFPRHASKIEALAFNAGSRVSGVFGGTQSSSGWANQTGRGLEVVEYYDAEGTHILIPEIDEMVDFHPNPLSTPAFVVAKRFAFNQLIGQYDHGIGLMAALAKFNILYLTAMEDNVFAPTNISGEVLSGQYKQGRRTVNLLAPGTSVDRPTDNIPFQAGEWTSRLERHLRNVIRYSVQDDADSPLNFATGAGLEELQTSVSAEVDEYQKVIRYALQDLDAKRLEWDEKVSGDTTKPLAGHGEAKAETYKPTKDIAGQYKTRREHGIMATFDEPSKIVAGGQLLQMGLIDRRTFQEKIQGLDDLTLIDERRHDDQMEQILFQSLTQLAAQGDQRALMLAIEELPDGHPMKKTLQKFFTPEEPQMTDEEAALAQPAAQGPPPDITTVLSRLTQGGQAQGGIQTVSRAS